MVLGKSLASWRAEYPLLDELIALRETSWFNPGVAPAAEALARVFPETAGSGGIIESDILALPRLRAVHSPAAVWAEWGL